MRFKTNVDGADHQIMADPDGALALDADHFVAQVSSPSPERRVVRVADKSYEVRVIEDGTDSGKYVLELGGERILATVMDVSRDAAPAVASPTAAPAPLETIAKPLEPAGEGIRAPMPGMIVEILVQPGDAIEAGDPVLILEAMKMENEVRTTKKATVTSVLVKKGDRAERGQLLVGLD